MSDDVDATSDDSDVTVVAGANPKLSVYRDSDHISPLIAHSTLLTSLLRMYPSSTDQTGLREDIGLLAASTNRGVREWVSEEDRKQRPSSLEVVRARRAVEGILDREKERDKEVRDLLRAEAGIWDDGSGGGVVDVFSAAENEADVAVSIEESDEVRSKGVCGWSMVR